MSKLWDFIASLFRARQLPEAPAETIPGMPPGFVAINVTAFGETFRMGVKANPDGSPMYSGEDVAKMAILCADCMQPIYVGQSVICRIVTNEELAELRNDPHVHVVEGDPPRALCCYTMNCAPISVLPSGRWLPDPDNPGKGTFVACQHKIYTV